VTDEEILAAYRDLAAMEGIFCEPSSAASVAGVAMLARGGELDADALVVCVLTGNGLKDPDTAERLAGDRLIESSASADAVRSALGW
jgi:threonine synthase